MKLNAKNIPWKPILYIGGGLLAYKFVLKPLFDKFGLTKSEASKAIEEASKLPGWNMDFWSQALQQKKITWADIPTNRTSNLAVPINHALSKSIFKDDDEQAVFSELRKLQTQAQLSYLSKAYNTVYKKNLFEHLRDKFSENEMVDVINIVKPLPLHKAKAIGHLPTIW